MKLSVLGGSSVATVQLAGALGQEFRSGPPVELLLHGRNSQRLGMVAEQCRALLAPTWRTSTTRAMEEAVTGVDVLLVQVRIGGLPARAFDETFPQAVGLPGEETLGPGGFLNALRTVRALAPVWAQVRRNSHEALVVILTNPAGIVAQAARRAGLNALEVCDAPPALLAKIGPRTGLSRQETTTRYVGMNHVGWYVPEQVSALSSLFDLTQVAGVVSAAHEALPLHYLRFYLDPDRIAAAQVGRPTRASELMEVERRAVERMAAGAAPESQERPAPWYELGVVPLLAALWGDTETTLLAGMANGQRIPNLPPDVTVEGPVSVAGPDSIIALPVADLPPLPAAVLGQHAVYEQAALEAAIAPSPAAVFRALLANPMVRDQARAEQLVEIIQSADPQLSGVSPEEWK